MILTAEEILEQVQCHVEFKVKKDIKSLAPNRVGDEWWIPNHEWDFAEANVCEEYIKNLTKVRTIIGPHGGPFIGVYKKVDPSLDGIIAFTYWEEQSCEVWVC